MCTDGKSLAGWGLTSKVTGVPAGCAPKIKSRIGASG
jgi:hypothetical protein